MPADGADGRAHLEGQVIQAVLQDRFEAAIRGRVDGQRPGRGGFEALGPIILAEPEDPQAGPIALLL